MSFLLRVELGLPDQQGSHRRYKGEREDKRANEGEHEGGGHRLERLALHTFQRKDRCEHQQDDHLAEGCRARHFPRRVGGHTQSLHGIEGSAEFRTPLAKHQQGGLDHNYRAIYKDSEVQRTQAHQVAADTELVHADNSEQERQRNDQCGDGCRTQVAQEQEQHNYDQQGTFGQVLGDSLDSGVNQHTTVQHWLCEDIGGQRFVDLCQALSCSLSDGAAVAAGDHERRAQYRLMTISASCTKPWGAPHTDLGNIGHPDDHTVLGGHRRLSQVVGRQGKAVCPNDQAFARTLDETRASLDVGAFQCLDQIGQTQVVCRQSSAVGVDAVFLDVPTHRINTGQAGAGAHLWCDDPVLDSTQVRCALLGGSKTIALWCQVDLTLLPASLAGLGQLLGVEWLEVHRPHENLAQPGCNRGEHGGHALGQISGSLPHPLCHLLAGEIDVGLISEDRGDLREAIA